MRRRIIQFLNRFYCYQLMAAYFHKLSVKLFPEREVNRVFSVTFGHNPDLKNPKSLIEKFYWLELYSDTSLWTECADKYRVRDYVARCGLSDHLPKLYAKWDSAKDMDFSTLPNEFILKTNNGCAQCVIVKDKSVVDINAIKKQFQRWLSVPYGYSGCQLHYTKIKPCIIAEELLVQSEEQKSFSPLSLADYKVYCMDGNPESVWVAYNRTAKDTWMALFDLEWNPMPDKLVNLKDDVYHPEVVIPKPTCLDEMLKMAKVLAKPFPEVRVDFYVISGKPVIGELTFTSGYGFFTEDYYNYLGSKITLPKLDDEK